MRAYTRKIGEHWYGFVETPLGLWVPLERYFPRGWLCEDYLKSLGFTVITPDA